MQLSSRTDIEAPLDYVYVALTDFEGWERAAMRRGADVARTDNLRTPGPGMAWKLDFRFRGKDRSLTLRLTDLEPDTRLAFAGGGRMFEGDGKLEVVSLAPNRTRLTLKLEMRPLTLGARLVMQSVKLAKDKVQDRLNKRMAGLALELEQRYASTRRR